uniref:Small RNA degrading nuclease 2 n=1 Tax=Hirondellea gigas TaxID=1518452 RepID=A0A6A7G6R4_9CRUS
MIESGPGSPATKKWVDVVESSTPTSVPRSASPTPESHTPPIKAGLGKDQLLQSAPSNVPHDDIHSQNSQIQSQNREKPRRGRGGGNSRGGRGGSGNRSGPRGGSHQHFRRRSPVRYPQQNGIPKDQQLDPSRTDVKSQDNLPTANKSLPLNNDSKSSQQQRRNDSNHNIFNNNANLRPPLATVLSSSSSPSSSSSSSNKHPGKSPRTARRGGQRMMVAPRHQQHDQPSHSSYQQQRPDLDDHRSVRQPQQNQPRYNKRDQPRSGKKGKRRPQSSQQNSNFYQQNHSQYSHQQAQPQQIQQPSQPGFYGQGGTVPWGQSGPYYFLDPNQFAANQVAQQLNQMNIVPTMPQPFAYGQDGRPQAHPYYQQMMFSPELQYQQQFQAYQQFPSGFTTTATASDPGVTTATSSAPLQFPQDSPHDPHFDPSRMQPHPVTGGAPTASRTSHPRVQPAAQQQQQQQEQQQRPQPSEPLVAPSGTSQPTDPNKPTAQPQPPTHSQPSPQPPSRTDSSPPQPRSTISSASSKDGASSEETAPSPTSSAPSSASIDPLNPPSSTQTTTQAPINSKQFTSQSPSFALRGDPSQVGVLSSNVSSVHSSTHSSPLIPSHRPSPDSISRMKSPFSGPHDPSQFKLPAGPVYSVDVECVATGKTHSARAVAQISLVAENGVVVLNSYVKPRQKVVSYLNLLTGLNQQILDSRGIPLEVAIQQLKNSLPKQAILVGQNIQSDIEWLGLVEGVDFAGMLDLCGLWAVWNPKYNMYTKFSLNHESYCLLGSAQPTPHDAAYDAIMSMHLYQLFLQCRNDPELLRQSHERLLNMPPMPSFAKQNPYYDDVCMGNKKICRCGDSFKY